MSSGQLSERVSNTSDSYPDDIKEINLIIDDTFKNEFREMILKTGLRSDGRKTTDIREIIIEPSK
jgi:polyribonucleotide nucleotidyltransferase